MQIIYQYYFSYLSAKYSLLYSNIKYNKCYKFLSNEICCVFTHLPMFNVDLHPLISDIPDEWVQLFIWVCVTSHHAVNRAERQSAVLMSMINIDEAISPFLNYWPDLYY